MCSFCSRILTANKKESVKSVKIKLFHKLKNPIYYVFTMPDFDLRTIVFMSMLLTFVLSMLLGLTRAHHKSYRGPGYWAVGNLFVGLGMVLVLIQLDNKTVFLPSAAVIGAGLSLYINGIQAFAGQQPDHRIPPTMFAALFLINFFFMVIRDDMRSVVVIDAFIFATIYLACARLTFAKEEGLLGNLYWIASSLFMLLGVLMLGRAATAVLVDARVFDSFATWPVNAYTFMIGAVSQFFVSSLFVLMLSYKLNQNLENMATVDGLTETLNRRGLEASCAKISALCKRTYMDMAVLLIDVDFFKKVNDKHGHLVGDEVLKHMASIIQNVLRRGDVVGRYGGEEFVIFMPNTVEDDASVLAERIRLAIADQPFVSDEVYIPVTVSIGVADSVRAGFEFKGLVSAADATLYKAKDNGRNNVMRFTQINLTLGSVF